MSCHNGSLVVDLMETVTLSINCPTWLTSVSLNRMVGDELLTQEEVGEIVTIPVSNTILEHRGVKDDPIVAQSRTEHETSAEGEVDSEIDLWGEDHSPPEDLMRVK